MQTEKLNSGQYKVVATGFLSLFSIVGIMFYGLPFFFDFWVKEFDWSRATVTSGNVAGKVIIGPLFGFAAGPVFRGFLIFSKISSQTHAGSEVVFYFG